MKNLLVVQPYLAEYRKPFWDRALALLADEGVRCTVAAGAPDRSFAGRGDQFTAEGVISTRSRSQRLAGATIRWQSSWRLWGGFDALVLEASGSLVDTSVALWGQRPVGLWGHIDSFTGPKNAIDDRVEAWQLRRARSVMAYTERGADAAKAYGVDPKRISVLNNTIDTDALRAEMASMSRQKADEILGTAGWEQTSTLCFIGGIDIWKRVDFLVDALNILWRARPDLRLIVAGRGDLEHLFASSQARGQVRLIGRAGDREKAALSQVSSAIMMPGRVGLVAVDSFALGLPIITTEYPFHAPEFDYLSPGVDSLVTADKADVYAATVDALFRDTDALEKLRLGSTVKAGWPGLDAMAQSFTAGCVRLFEG